MRGDVLDGVSRTCQDGRERLRSAYRAGLLHGTTTAWDEQGRRTHRARYRHGVLHGTAERWEDGVRREAVRYVAGIRHGVSTSWHPDGSTAAVVPWAADHIEGVPAWYFEGGGVARTAEFRAGVQEGTATEFWPGGTMRSRAGYRAGVPDGALDSFAPDGRQQQRTWFRQGVPVFSVLCLWTAADGPAPPVPAAPVDEDAVHPASLADADRRHGAAVDGPRPADANPRRSADRVADEAALDALHPLDAPAAVDRRPPLDLPGAADDEPHAASGDGPGAVPPRSGRMTAPRDRDAPLLIAPQIFDGPRFAWQPAAFDPPIAIAPRTMDGAGNGGQAPRTGHPIAIDSESATGETTESGSQPDGTISIPRFDDESADGNETQAGERARWWLFLWMLQVLARLTRRAEWAEQPRAVPDPPNGEHDLLPASGPDPSQKPR
jgi:antitoxin component YwqK of YwqJK toxin-antitoxin module